MYQKHLYYGNGKGKTTAALGLALRAAGCGMKIHIVQFLKGNETSELKSLKKLENISFSRCDRNYGFSSKMNNTDKIEITKCHNNNFNEAVNMVKSGKIDMLILDEIIDAYNLNLINKTSVIELISEKPLAEIILTGHNPEQIFIESADYVSEINAIKHPYEKGITARKGIEY